MKRNFTSSLSTSPLRSFFPSKIHFAIFTLIAMARHVASYRHPSYIEQTSPSWSSPLFTPPSRTLLKSTFEFRPLYSLTTMKLNQTQTWVDIEPMATIPGKFYNCAFFSSKECIRHPFMRNESDNGYRVTIDPNLYHSVEIFYDHIMLRLQRLNSTRVAKYDINPFVKEQIILHEISKELLEDFTARARSVYGIFTPGKIVTNQSIGLLGSVILNHGQC